MLFSRNCSFTFHIWISDLITIEFLFMVWGSDRKLFLFENALDQVSFTEAIVLSLWNALHHKSGIYIWVGVLDSVLCSIGLFVCVSVHHWLYSSSRISDPVFTIVLNFHIDIVINYLFLLKLKSSEIFFLFCFNFFF